ncbi:HAD family phosphatase [Candidatus Saccharibacteria bacterium]|nr:HAD family phosphatase [Candidatus Saccharibacteria bacterium]
MAKKTGRPFAVFDIDGTLVRWQLYHAVADSLVKLGYIDSGAYAAVRDARMQWKRRSGPEAFKIYERQLVKAYEKILLKLTLKQFNEAAKAVFEQYKDQIYTYTRELTKKLKAEGYLLFAISGSQSEIVEKIASYYGFDDFVGTHYHHENGRFTGAVTVHLGGKHLILEELVKKHRASAASSIGVGDSANDISMLEAVETPIAFNPDRKLFDVAQSKGWKIILERKNMVYELEQQNGKYVLAKTN